MIVALALCLCPAIAFAAGDGDDEQPASNRHQACNWPNYHAAVMKRLDEMRTCWEKHGDGVEPAIAEVEWVQPSPPPDGEVNATVTTGSDDLAACLTEQFEAIAIRSTDDTTCKADLQLTYKPGGPKNDVRYEITAKSPDSSKKHGTKEKAPSKNDAESKKLKNIFGEQGDIDGKMKVAMSGDGEKLQVGRDAGGMGLRGTGETPAKGGEGFGRVGGLGKVDTGEEDDKTEEDGADEKKRTPQPADLPVATDRLEASEGCNSDDLLKKLQGKSNSFEYCYKRRLQIAPELEGDVTVRWTLDKKGQVTSTEVDDESLGSKKVSSCVRRVLKRIRFEEPNKASCEASYGFEFRKQ